MTSNIASKGPEMGFCCDLVASASFEGTAAEIAGLRKSPGTLGDRAMPNGLLRHVDEQAVVGVLAVLKAVRGSGLDPDGFARWSVLAAPRFLGRAKFEASFPQYQAEGAWGVSPHLVPGHSLHSPSGTISLALQAHGANLGTGGTVGGEQDALLMASTFLEAGWAEGVWVVLSARKPLVMGEVAQSPPGDYHALALALKPSKVSHAGIKIRVSPDAIRLESSDRDAQAVGEIREWITVVESPAGSTWRVDGGHLDSTLRHHQPRLTARRPK